MTPIRRSTNTLPARAVGPILGALVLLASPAAAQQFVPVPSRTVELTTSVTLPPQEATAHVWVPVPLVSSVQRVLDLSVQAPGPWTVEREPMHGNRFLYVEVPPSDREATIHCAAVVERLEWLGAEAEPLSGDALAPYLEPLPLVPVGGPVLGPRTERALANAGPEPFERGRKLFDYVLAEMDYDKSGEGWGRGDALYACDVHKGNCTDFHAMFNGMARTAGIPARFTMGLSLPAEPSGEITGYHCWTAFWVPEKGWVPVDISEADKHPDRPATDYFARLDENRIALTRGRNLTLAPAQAGPPLNYAYNAYVEVGGQPSAVGTTTRTYRDLSRADLIFRLTAR